jgi:acetolactate synthase I/II/III large subunit
MTQDVPIDGGELVARCLASAGVDRLFTLHGGHLDPILQACMDHGIEVVDTRHEAAAGHAADAYARQTGRCSVAVATAGPGFTNILTAMAQCHLDGSPVLVIAGAPPLRDAERWPLQGGIDQVAMARPVCKWAAQVTRTELIPHLMAQAFREAVTGRPGPVLLEIPIDVLFNRVAEQSILIPPAVSVPRPAPAPDQVTAALDLLASAKRPAIFCGGGILYAHAADAVRSFAEHAGVPVYANNRARGVLPADHPLYAGPHTNIAVAGLSGIGTPDVMLVLGARFGMFTEPGMLGPGRVPPDDCHIIQVDVSAAELGRIRPVEQSVVADCGEMVRALLAVEPGPAWPDWSVWSRSVHELVSWHRTALEVDGSASGPLHPYRVVDEVFKALGDDAIVCADGGEASFWAEMVSRPASAGRLMSHGYLGCLGIGLPFAIGAQLAHPNRRVAVITGDGSVGFNLQEFDTLVRHRLPVITVVLNNKAWGMCVHGQQAMYGDNRLVATRLGDARYDLAAAGLGCHGEYVEHLDDVGPAVQRALVSGQPACINVITDLDVSPAGRPSASAVRASQAHDAVVLPYYDA